MLNVVVDHALPAISKKALILSYELAFLATAVAHADGIGVARDL
jgi:hypothetical protein